MIRYSSGGLGFPKGRRRARETLASAAAREVAEETGVTFLPAVCLGYSLRTNGKRVYLFMGAVKSVTAHGDQESVWVPIGRLLTARFEYLEDRRFASRHLHDIRRWSV